MLAHYTIISKIGAGGIGEVYRTRDEKLNSEVAIKVLPADIAHDEERLRRFKREAQVTLALCRTEGTPLKSTHKVLSTKNKQPSRLSGQ
jgi:serine/threonine protein kinase